MVTVRTFSAAFAVSVAVGVLLVALQTRMTIDTLGDPSVLTGWLLLSVMTVLSLFNLRKRLSMLPLGRVAYWLAAHWILGLGALAIFWLHIGTAWPHGTYEKWLTIAFYVTTVTGIFGYLIQLSFPKRLTQSGMEVIYERIPGMLYDIRREAEEIVLECTRESGVETLSRHYLESLAWFFRRPRFYLSHVVGMKRGEAWIRHETNLVSRYLSDTEKTYLARLGVLALQKNEIDLHYALQDIMKRWLLVHLPAAVAMVILTVWHVLLIYVYIR